MSIQTYTTKRGAERYATEIKAKFPHVTTAVVPGASGFDYVVRVDTGKAVAIAGKRPRNYAMDCRDKVEAIL